MINQNIRSFEKILIVRALAKMTVDKMNIMIEDIFSMEFSFLTKHCPKNAAATAIR